MRTRALRRIREAIDSLPIGMLQSARARRRCYQPPTGPPLVTQGHLLNPGLQALHEMLCMSSETGVCGGGYHAVARAGQPLARNLTSDPWLPGVPARSTARGMPHRGGSWPFRIHNTASPTCLLAFHLFRFQIFETTILFASRFCGACCTPAGTSEIPIPIAWAGSTKPKAPRTGTSCLHQDEEDRAATAKRPSRIAGAEVRHRNQCSATLAGAGASTGARISSMTPSLLDWAVRAHRGCAAWQQTSSKARRCLP